MRDAVANGVGVLAWFDAVVRTSNFDALPAREGFEFEGFFLSVSVDGENLKIYFLLHAEFGFVDEGKVSENAVSNVSTFSRDADGFGDGEVTVGVDFDSGIEVVDDFGGGCQGGDGKENRAEQAEKVGLAVLGGHFLIL